MAKGAPTIVESSVLKWAREAAGYTIHDLARRFSKDADEISAWESDDPEKRPYMRQLRELANLYKRPLSDFFLPEPPQESPIPHDFRRSPGSVAGLYTPDLRKQLRFARERQDLSRALSEELTHESIPSFTHKISTDTAPEKVGQLIRSILHISSSPQNQTGNDRTVYNFWRRRLEATGILVFQFEKIPSEQVWGFSIAERPFPVIAVNVDLSPNARTFTMLHELTHILLGENGICDIDDSTPRGQAELRIEIFCNHAAAAALMPKSDFLAHPVVASRQEPAIDWTDIEIFQIAKSFGTSREAAVRRLLTFNRTTNEFYEMKRAEYHAQYLAQINREEQLQKKPFRRDYAQRAVSNLGTKFVGLVLSSYHDKLLSLADTAKFLEVRPHKVSKVRELTLRSED